MLVRKPPKTAWLSVTLESQSYDQSICHSTVGRAARKWQSEAVDDEPATDDQPDQLDAAARVPNFA